MTGCCCKTEEERRKKIKAMTHEERIKYAKGLKGAGMGMVVAGIGCFVGVGGGLWGSMGASAIGVAFGCASGLLFGSCGLFGGSNEALKWDKEFESLTDNAVQPV